MSLATADGPSWGRALALAGKWTYAGNHQGMPYTIDQSQSNKKAWLYHMTAQSSSTQVVEVHGASIVHLAS